MVKFVCAHPGAFFLNYSQRSRRSSSRWSFRPDGLFRADDRFRTRDELEDHRTISPQEARSCGDGLRAQIRSRSSWTATALEVTAAVQRSSLVIKLHPRTVTATRVTTATKLFQGVQVHPGPWRPSRSPRQTWSSQHRASWIATATQ